VRTGSLTQTKLFFILVSDGSTREEALSKLQSCLSQRYTAEVLDTQRDDLMDLLKKSIKKGGARECIAAAAGNKTGLFVCLRRTEAPKLHAFVFGLAFYLVS
jgi:hypothetical protein